jgi:hypothetical protein
MSCLCSARSMAIDNSPNYQIWEFDLLVSGCEQTLNYDCIWKAENLISQILKDFHVRNQLCLYMKTWEPQLLTVFLIPSISLYAGYDTQEEALALYGDMLWRFYLSIGYPIGDPRAPLRFCRGLLFRPSSPCFVSSHWAVELFRNLWCYSGTGMWCWWCTG